MKPPFRILVVCLGNICRSPMVEGLLRHRLTTSGRAQIAVIDSAGTGSWHEGQPPDPRATLVCSEHGIAIETLRARRIVARDFEEFDLILCADRNNLRHLRAIAPPAAQPKIALLLHWAGQGIEAEVPDPYDGNLDDFRNVYRLLEGAVDAVLTRLQLPA